MTKMKDSISSNPALREMSKEVFWEKEKEQNKCECTQRNKSTTDRNLKLSCYLNIFKRYLNIIKILLRY